MATLCAVPNCLVIALSSIFLWSALVFLIAPGFGDMRSHNGQTVSFAHFDSSTVWTACSACSAVYPCIPAMRVISCSLWTNPSKDFTALWLYLDIADVFVLLRVPLLPQPWCQQAEIWPLLLDKAVRCWLAVGSHNPTCKICASTEHTYHMLAQGPCNDLQTWTCYSLQTHFGASLKSQR